jgi:ribosomal protein L28
VNNPDDLSCPVSQKNRYTVRRFYPDGQADPIRNDGVNWMVLIVNASYIRMINRQNPVAVNLMNDKKLLHRNVKGFRDDLVQKACVRNASLLRAVDSR